MAQPVIQTSFNSGEWSPSLNARVDIQKYHSGAALLENFFVDYRGGATASPGTRYVIQSASSGNVRLLPFQASLNVSYIIEAGQTYMRFYNNGAPVLEAAITISDISKANPGVITTAGAHGFAPAAGQLVYFNNILGMTQLNGNYYYVDTVPTANTFTIRDFFTNVIVNTTSYGTYTLPPGTVARVYTLTSPYNSNEVDDLKYAQNVNKMVLCHPNYPPYELTLVSASNWSLAPIVFGSTVATPLTPTVTPTLAAGVVNYAYLVTAVDAGGQESGPSSYGVPVPSLDLRSNAGSMVITWTAVPNAASYNIYKAEPKYAGIIQAGAMFGFIGNASGTEFVDSNIEPDFSEGPPIPQNPFSGSGIQSVTVTNPGSYTNGQNIPYVTFTGGGGGTGANATAYGKATLINILSAGIGFDVGETYTLPYGVVIRIDSIFSDGSGVGQITGISIVNGGSLPSGGVTPPNPVQIIPVRFGVAAWLANLQIFWGVGSVGIINPGTGYSGATGITFSSGAAAGTVALGAPSSGNPTVPGFFQQRLVLAGPTANPQQINMSQPGAYYNFNITNPIAPDNAFSGSLVSGTLNSIQSMIPQPQGLVVLSDQSAWLINGGSAGAPISAVNAVANAQVFSGASFLPPLPAVDNVLYVQSKNSIVRDMVFNYGKQVYTGMDISVMSSHLFYANTLLEWAWAEEPFKLVYAVRNDGIILNLTFLKEQELVAWTHRTTQGSFKSVATITENSSVGKVNAVYLVVQRNIQGLLRQYIERVVEQDYTDGLIDAWQVDSGLRYQGVPSLNFSGAQHLGGQVVTGVSVDNQNVFRILSFTMPLNGNFSLAAPGGDATGYVSVVVGLGYTPKLQTLALDTGNPTIQGKMKKINGVTVRVKDTLGLEIGSDFNNLVPMKDLVIGNVGTATNQLVTNLVTGDAYTAIDPGWTVQGQYCLRQPNPFPASILGVIPQLAIGDTPSERG